MDIIHRVIHRYQTKVHVPRNNEENGCHQGRHKSEGGCHSWYAAVDVDPQRWAIRQDHIRNDVAVRSIAGSVVLKDCTLS